MSEPPTVPSAATVSYFFRGQLVHLLALVVLVPVAWALAAPALDARSQPWFVAAIAVAVVHQVYVWLGWGWFTRVFGRADFTVWNLVFVPLLIARPVLITVLAVRDAGSLALPAGLSVALGALLLVPPIAVGWSIHRYLGFARASGGDHFRREFREMPFERRGAFRWTPNPMYLLAFLGLWAIALLARSQVALVAALFQHAYIWVHYLSVEQPDLETMFGTAR